MALARAHVWNAGDLLKAADLNGEFNNILNNPISLISPTTGVITFSTAQTFPTAQLISTKTDAGAAVSLTTAGLHTEGTLVIPGTAALQFSSTTSLQVGLGVLPLKSSSGNWVQRNISVPIAINSTSTSVASTGALAANTTYLVYAFDNAGVTNVTAGTTGVLPHSPSTENGTEVATTDSTRTLVGMFRTNATAQFADGGNNRFVASWYGRRFISAVGAITTASSFNRTTYAEHTSNGRAEFVTWGDKTITCSAGGGDIENETVGGFVFCAIGLDGGTSSVCSRGAGGGQSAVAASRFFWGAQGNFTTSQVTEGYHFVTLATRVNTSTGVLNTGSDPETTIITANLVI